jgi:hypothetical protein
MHPKGNQLAVNSIYCACGGKNKNCFTCLVAGNVKPTKPPKTISRVKVVHQGKHSLGEAGESKTKYVRLEEAFLVKDSEMVVCSDCSLMVKDLEKHRRKVHGVQDGSVSEPLPKLAEAADVPTNPLFTLQKCHVCGSMVSDMDKHMKKAKHVDETKKRTLLVLQAETGEMICPFCTSSWPNRAEVSSHVKRAHGKHARAELRFALPRRPTILNRKRNG